MLEARKKIDEIDKKIIELLEERMDAVSQIAEYKAKNNIDVLDTKREEEVYENLRNAIKNLAYQDTLLKIFSDIMKHSKEYQREKNLRR